MQIKKYIPIIFAILLLAISIGISLYYTFMDQGSMDLDTVSMTDTRREEIQRYFGYEPLLSRYLTLPYDVSVNTNQQGSFVDIGYLYLIFLPLILLGILYRSFIKWITMGLLFGLLVISVGNSFIYVDNERVGAANAHEILTLPNTNIIDVILAYCYMGLNAVHSVIAPLIDTFSGDQDFITYPIIITGFLIFIYALFQFNRQAKRRDLYLSLTAASYAFFFFAFSSGIIWYGYLLFLLLLLGIISYLKRIESNNSNYFVWIKLSFVIMSITWIVFSLIGRISNIQAIIPDQHQGKAIITPDVYYYNTGEIKSVSELKDEFITPGFSDAMAKINADLSTKVFKIGTGLTYFIKQNHKRVIYDNQLGLFSQIVKNYNDKYIISDLLKASGVKYLIIDLNTPSIDKTPEKTLFRKYLQVLEYVKNNDSVSLICTDNVVTKKGTKNIVYAFSEDPKDLVRPGSFAIYEIN